MTKPRHLVNFSCGPATGTVRACWLRSAPGRDRRVGWATTEAIGRRSADRAVRRGDVDGSVPGVCVPESTEQTAFRSALEVVATVEPRVAAAITAELSSQ